MTIEEISKKIAEEFDNAVAKAFVLSVWKLLKDNGINVCLTQEEVDHIEEQRGKTYTWNRTYNLDFNDLDTSEHDAAVRQDVLDEYKWISVKDKMPKDCNEDWVMVMVYDGDFRCVPTVAEYRNGHWYGNEFCTEDDCIDGEDSPFEVRYWKPIYDEVQIEYLKDMGYE